MAKENTKPSYYIEYSSKQQCVVIANDIPQMEVAVKFALNLHEASNVEHVIHVVHDDLIDVTFTRK